MNNAPRSRHIVFLAFHYPPDPEVGSVRAGAVVAALLEGGHRVEVVTGALPGESPGIRERRDRLTVHAVSWPRNPLQAMLALRRGLGGRPAARGNGPVAQATAPVQSGFKRALVSTLHLPDEFQGFIPAAARKAAALIRYGGGDLCYSTAPPFSTALAGLAVNVFTGVPWILEYRDPWNDVDRYHSESRPALLRKWEHWLERRSMDRASGLVAVTPSFGSLLRERLGQPQSRKVVVALNGVPAFRAPVPRAPGSPITILHAGTMYGPRNPSRFLEIVAQLRERHGSPYSNLRIEFLGIAPDPALDELIARLGLGDMARSLPPVSLAEARTRMAEADLLLLLAPEQPMQVPHKMFEYLGARKAILGFLDREGDTWNLLEGIGGHFLIDHRDMSMGLEGVERAVSAAARGPDGTIRPLDPAVSRLRTGDQFASINQLIDDLT